MHSSASSPSSLLASRMIRGFYAVLDRVDLALADALVRPMAQGGAGARVLQLRIKDPDVRVAPSELQQLAVAVRRLTQLHGAAFIVNDDLALALASGADGVHLGQDDLPLAQARQQVVAAGVADRFLLGISTHTPAQVSAACLGGADYLGFGPVFATATKRNPDPVVGITGLAAACTTAGRTPVVAIGGIQLTDAPSLFAAGAAAVCAISSVNGASNPAAAGAQISACVTV